MGGQNDLESQEETDTGKEMMKVTRVNIYDHIRNRSRRLQALPCFGSAPTHTSFFQMDDSTSGLLVKMSSDAKDGSFVKKFKDKKANDVCSLHTASTKDSDF